MGRLGGLFRSVRDNQPDMASTVWLNGYHGNKVTVQWYLNQGYICLLSPVFSLPETRESFWNIQHLRFHYYCKNWTRSSMFSPGFIHFWFQPHLSVKSDGSFEFCLKREPLTESLLMWTDDGYSGAASSCFSPQCQQGGEAFFNLSLDHSRWPLQISFPFQGAFLSSRRAIKVINRLELKLINLNLI